MLISRSGPETRQAGLPPRPGSGFRTPRQQAPTTRAVRAAAGLESPAHGSHRAWQPRKRLSSQGGRHTGSPDVDARNSRGRRRPSAVQGTRGRGNRAGLGGVNGIGSRGGELLNEPRAQALCPYTGSQPYIDSAAPESIRLPHSHDPCGRGQLYQASHSQRPCLVNQSTSAHYRVTSHVRALHPGTLECGV